MIVRLLQALIVAGLYTGFAAARFALWLCRIAFTDLKLLEAVSGILESSALDRQLLTIPQAAPGLSILRANVRVAIMKTKGNVIVHEPRPIRDFDAEFVEPEETKDREA